MRLRARVVQRVTCSVCVQRVRFSLFVWFVLSDDLVSCTKTARGALLHFRRARQNDPRTLLRTRKQVTLFTYAIFFELFQKICIGKILNSDGLSMSYFFFKLLIYTWQSVWKLIECIYIILSRRLSFLIKFSRFVFSGTFSKSLHMNCSNTDSYRLFQYFVLMLFIDILYVFEYNIWNIILGFSIFLKENCFIVRTYFLLLFE